MSQSLDCHRRTKPCTRERRNSFPDVDVLCATNVSEDWEEAVKSASKMPLTPGPGIKKGANPFAFSNKDKLSHLKKALVSEEVRRDVQNLGASTQHRAPSIGSKVRQYGWWKKNTTL